jgi:hypothetical protein
MHSTVSQQPGAALNRAPTSSEAKSDEPVDAAAVARNLRRSLTSADAPRSTVPNTSQQSRPVQSELPAPTARHQEAPRSGQAKAAEPVDAAAVAHHLRPLTSADAPRSTAPNTSQQSRPVQTEFPPPMQSGFPAPTVQQQQAARSALPYLGLPPLWQQPQPRQLPAVSHPEGSGPSPMSAPLVPMPAQFQPQSTDTSPQTAAAMIDKLKAITAAVKHPSSSTFEQSASETAGLPSVFRTDESASRTMPLSQPLEGHLVGFEPSRSSPPAEENTGEPMLSSPTPSEESTHSSPAQVFVGARDPSVDYGQERDEEETEEKEEVTKEDQPDAELPHQDAGDQPLESDAEMAEEPARDGESPSPEQVYLPHSSPEEEIADELGEDREGVPAITLPVESPSLVTAMVPFVAQVSAQHERTVEDDGEYVLDIAKCS